MPREAPNLQNRARNLARYVLIPVEGPVILFEFEGCHHLAQGLGTIDEIRPAVTVSYVAAASRLDKKAQRWAAEIGDLVRQHGGGSRRVAIERVYSGAAAALAAQGFEIVDAQELVERARAVKAPEEITCILATTPTSRAPSSAAQGGRLTSSAAFTTWPTSRFTPTSIYSSRA